MAGERHGPLAWATAILTPPHPDAVPVSNVWNPSHRSMLNNKIPNSRVLEIVTEAVAIEIEFITEVGRGRGVVRH
jgi:hypothetical protein